MSISPGIKVLLGFSPGTADEIINKWWKKRTKRVCKPCWELKYCPYGKLVEEFPLPPMAKTEAIEHNEFLQKMLMMKNTERCLRMR